MNSWPRLRLRFRPGSRASAHAEANELACVETNRQIEKARADHAEAFAGFLLLKHLIGLIDMSKVELGEIDFDGETVAVPLAVLRPMVEAWRDACRDPDSHDFREFVGVKGRGKYSPAAHERQANHEVLVAALVEGLIRTQAMSRRAAQAAVGPILEEHNKALAKAGQPPCGTSIDAVKRADRKQRGRVRAILDTMDGRMRGGGTTS